MDLFFSFTKKQKIKNNNKKGTGYLPTSCTVTVSMPHDTFHLPPSLNRIDKDLCVCVVQGFFFLFFSFLSFFYGNIFNNVEERRGAFFLSLSLSLFSCLIIVTYILRVRVRI
ncbi:hypothetical protein DM02DRAFT_243419 [Periconia macrospinosa]|uniref:Transmembrane protein n=1 Tax=Periconia macrospinosa TaxID=97972 RepID=A0A2V1D7R8_9PLEO|nr:hypothetical protein DM02DRAFT_243419 [Periconia macrospinosa]